MSGLRHISSTLAFVVAFAIAPLFLQHCVMAETVLPRIFACENERPVEPPCHDEGEADVEICCSGVDAMLIEDAVTLERNTLPTPTVVEALVLTSPAIAVHDSGNHGRADALPPPAAGTRLSVLFCTFLC
jgi:hypothetical protein